MSSRHLMAGEFVGRDGMIHDHSRPLSCPACAAPAPASLFPDLYRQVAPKAMPETASREAREWARRSAGPLCQKIHAWLLGHGPATDEDMQREMGLPANTQRPRRRELEKAGRVRSVSWVRNERNRRATLWEALP